MKVFVFFLVIVGVVFALVLRLQSQQPDSPEHVLGELKTLCSTQGSQSGRMICLEKRLRGYVSDNNLGDYISALEVQFRDEDDANSGGITKCHEITHVLGILAGKRSDNISETFSMCTSLCGYGCYMGVTDGYLARGNNYIEESDTLCTYAKHPLPCWHAVGHTFVNRTGDLDEALVQCEGLPDVLSRSHCMSGAFMETYEFSGYGHEQKPVPPDMISYCSSIREEARPYCYTVSGYLTYRATSDNKKSIGMCGRVPSEWIGACFQMLGKNVYYDNNGSAERMRDFCGMVDAPFRQDCTHGVLFASVTSDPLARHGRDYCSFAEASERQKCFGLLGELVESNGGENSLHEVCATLSPQDSTSCKMHAL